MRVADRRKKGFRRLYGGGRRRNAVCRSPCRLRQGVFVPRADAPCQGAGKARNRGKLSGGGECLAGPKRRHAGLLPQQRAHRGTHPVVYPAGGVPRHEYAHALYGGYLRGAGISLFRRVPGPLQRLRAPGAFGVRGPLRDRDDPLHPGPCPSEERASLGGHERHAGYGRYPHGRRGRGLPLPGGLYPQSHGALPDKAGAPGHGRGLVPWPGKLSA